MLHFFCGIRLLVFSSHLEDDEVDGTLKFVDGIHGAGKLLGNVVGFHEVVGIVTDGLAVRKREDGLAQLDGDIDVGLICLENVIRVGVALGRQGGIGLDHACVVGACQWLYLFRLLSASWVHLEEDSLSD